MLIVEDNNFIQQAVQMQLTLIGVDFESCLNGQEAVEQVEKYLKDGKMFDIILMDLIMPIMNGFKASAEIRELEKKYNIPESEKLFICGYSSQVGLGKFICFIYNNYRY
jgi:CheY-like chemotaxis protein